jgi:ribose 1,5-bisphosphokinase
MASASSRAQGGDTAPIGPGRVVVIVGPSGAGKDTLIRLAREALSGDDTIIFAQRIVTRAADIAEDNITLSPEEFARRDAQGAFAVIWSAHGLHYGYADSIDTDIKRGATVVLNLSRMAVGGVRARYANTRVILIDAEPALRRARLLARNREATSDVEARMARETAFQPSDADTIILNNADAQSAAGDLATVISGKA